MVVKPCRFKYFSISLFHFLFTEVRVNLNEIGDNKGNGAEEHDQYEEGVVAQLILQPT